ncbi:phosphomannomutase [Pseudonocardia sp. EC080610-09]|uniref:phosphomannomutase/phosphoglucomutase n=1 Tax=unclassified Pseudonocardia TaxID=2619320 RepID=UPI0006CB4288|nr:MULTISPECIES: phosphomannomutase/phosphoglucomutase [unclassified Pseudonocardia]ALE72319.1 phosphomannomutase [Pseudonocardia sp. EC080625-04]ALL75609.1 phosphomannomutase [Pseudonocardia sp. EC080610-09]ALL82638.1 phosphomannomutase [Pseudonocardia sp. EC080619-01]
MPDLSAIVKAYDIRGVVGDQLDEPTARALGAATARLVATDTPAPGAVVVGRDMRDSSPALAAAFADGVTGQGLDVVDIGLASTDMLYFASGSLGLPGAMFTASHNPARYNGIKLCRAGAVPIGQDSGLATIRDDAARLLGEGVPATGTGTVRREDMLTGYARYLRELVDLSTLAGAPELTVVVDAGNGMGGHTVPTVFDGLDVRVVPLYFELDGTFPNHEANPLDPANLVDLQKAVVAEGADLGLAFDGDADRCFAVDERGDAVSPSAITGLVAARELARAQAAGETDVAVIHNLITSRAVPELVAEHGGRPVRTRVGHSFIKQTMAETGAVFGGEHSAHYYFRDFWKADSGMLAALHLLAALGERRAAAAASGTVAPLSGLMAGYDRYAASGEINSTVADQAAKVAEIESLYGPRDGVELDRLDGLTVSLADGSWFNLRASNTEPLLRLNVEAADDAAVRTLVDEVLAVVRA